jgi:hypothetical protein
MKYHSRYFSLTFSLEILRIDKNSLSLFFVMYLFLAKGQGSFQLSELLISMTYWFTNCEIVIITVGDVANC